MSMSGFTSLGKKSSGLGGGTGNSNAMGPFGTALVSNLTPTSQGTFVYGTTTNNLQWLTSSNGTGSGVSISEGIMSCTSGASISGSATVKLPRYVKYRAGQGVVCRMTAIFDSGAPDTKQLAGIGNRESGYFFGRDGTSFGILHRETSKRMIYSMTVSAQASVTVTVTLGGVSMSFSIVGGSNANQTAYLISQADYSQVGSGWMAEASGATVYFISDVPGPIGGTFGINVGGVSIVTAASTVQAGVLPTETFISQSQWNIDTMDGAGTSRVSIDPTKGNVYGIGYQYLGFGDPVFSIENPETGLLQDVHRIQTANKRTSVVVRNPCMSAQWDAINSGSLATSVTVKGASAAVFNEGIVSRNVGVSFAATGVVSSVSTTIVPVLTIRANRVYGAQCNYGELSPFSLTVGNTAGNSATNKILKVFVYKNSGLGGPVNFQYVDSTRSIASVDTSATSLSTNAKTQLMLSSIISANDAVTFNIDAEYVANGDSLTVAVQRGGSADVEQALVSIGWFEDQ